MSITRDPTFKSAMFALAVTYIALISQSVWAAKPVNPPTNHIPVIPEDVNCVAFCWHS